LPEIPDYERPDLEKYDKSDFDPSKKVKIAIQHQQQEQLQARHEIEMSRISRDISAKLNSLSLSTLFGCDYN
jgi:hypothetical protein